MRNQSVKILFLALLLPVVSHAQLNLVYGYAIPEGWTADSLVENIFLGGGVDVSNVRFNGSTNVRDCFAIGYFTTGNTPTNLGISQGILISTGNVSVSLGPNDSPSSGGMMPSGCSNYNCVPLLQSVEADTLYDCAVLEFDFVPRSDSIMFRYVFASEEYPEYVCSHYNDVFGFFLTGPDPRSENGMYNNTNIALIPNTESTVAINSVNGGESGENATSLVQCNLDNTQFYHDNTVSSTVQYDGFTTPLTAEAKVVPCTRYHIVIAIADVSDNAWDSGVFLEANSLSSVSVQAVIDNPSNLLSPNEMYEGCESVIHFNRTSDTGSALVVTLSVEGDVTNGVDFNTIPPDLTIPSNVSDVPLPIIPTFDNVSEGTDGREYAKIVISVSNGCTRSDSLEFYIIDVDSIALEIMIDSIPCNSELVYMHAEVTGGIPNRTVTWRNTATGEILEGESVSVNTRQEALYEATVEDICGNIAVDTILVTSDLIPTISIVGDSGICGDDYAELTAEATFGSVYWTSDPPDPTLVGQETQHTIVVKPTVTTVYTVTSTNNSCTMKGYATVIADKPVAIADVTPKTVSPGEMVAVFTDQSINTTSRRWEFPDGTYKTAPQVSYIVPDDVDSINVLLWAYNPYMCFDTTTVTVHVDHTILWVPNAFTPDESTNNRFLVKYYDIQRYHILIYDRKGLLVFESFDPEKPWLGLNQKGKECPQGVYTYVISCHKKNHPYTQIVKKGTVVLIR